MNLGYFQSNAFFEAYVIPILGASVLFLIYYFFFAKRKKRKLPLSKNDSIESEESNDIEDDTESVLARIYDNSSIKVYNTWLPPGEVKKIKDTFGHLGRTWLRDGKWVYAFDKNIDGTYDIVRPTATLENPPTRTFRALQTQHLAMAYPVSVPPNFLEKYGMMLLLMGVVFFLLFSIIYKMI